MIKKATRIAIALVLALGLILSSTSVTLAKPQPTSEVTNLHLDGTALHFQLHLVNLNQAFSYKLSVARTGWTLYEDPFYALGKVSKNYISPEIIRDLSILPGWVGPQGKYEVKVELFNRRGISLGFINTATYTFVFNVTFNETNNLSGVSIQLYSDAARTVPKGSALITDEFGETSSIALEDDTTYWYKATRTDYIDVTGFLIVNGSNLTVNFHMPCTYTVTFNATNNMAGNLSDVYIYIYKYSGGSWDYINCVITDTAGQATIDLLEDDYYYYAQALAYAQSEGYFTVSGPNLTVSFTMMIPTYTVTFNETNALSGVSIAVWDDVAYGWVGNNITNGTGQATIDLPNSDYIYFAMKNGYATVEDDFTVSGSAQTIDFTMNAAYTVTFNETNGLEGVSIEVYSDPDCTEGVASRTTNSSGQATCVLPDGTYYYTATKTSFADLLGDFTVSGAPLTESFEMVTGNIFPLPFEEYFSESDVEGLPAGWTPGGNYSGLIWVDSTADAGGTSPELYFDYAGQSNNWTYSIYTPSIDATGVTSALNLSFRQLHLYYDNPGEPPPVSPPYSIAVEVSTDGGTTWGSTSFAYSPTADIGPETVNVDLGAYKGYTINIRWSISGYTYWTDGWYIDDIIVSGS